MLGRRVLKAAGILVASMAAWAVAWTASANDQVQRGPIPAWVAPDAGGRDTAPPNAEEGLRVLSFDAQYRAEETGQNYYLRTRSLASSPQGLALIGTVGLVWSPASQTVTVHHVNIVRDGQIIDVLANQSFDVLRREQNLEQAMLDGLLTANLQPTGLRVGDILDVAYSVTSSDPVVRGRIDQTIDMNMPLMVDRMRYRASWPETRDVRLAAFENWTPLPVRRRDGYASIEVVREAVSPTLPPDDLPFRLQQRNLVEISDYGDWSAVGTLLNPLYQTARRTTPSSALEAEITRIRALSDDPAIQAAAALRTVQDQVRYVALLMGEAALTPATAEQTWERRFGDCKGKTALLLALLDGLGIEAEAAAVSLTEGDGLNARLPGAGAFNHVLVRAVVNGQVYWLDGTRMGDRRLEDISTPPFHWALPLVAADARLEPLVVDPARHPVIEVAIAVDATAGRHAPAPITATMTLRDAAAASLAGQMGVASPSQRDQGLRAILGGVVAADQVDGVSSAYDDDTSILTLTLTGSTTLDWSNGLVPPGATYAPVTVAEREDAFTDAPYVIAHPNFYRQVATLKLPNDGAGYRVSGGAFDRTELGHRQSRAVSLDGDTVTIEINQRSLKPELSAEEVERDIAASENRVLDRPRVHAPDGPLTSDDRAALAADTPTTSGEWLDRGFLLYNAGDRAGALKAGEKAVELDSNSATAWANLGVYRFHTGDTDGAREALGKAVEIDPSERIAMNGHALLARMESRHQDVVIEMTRALRQAPTDTFALGMRTQAYAGLRQYDRALKDMDALIAIDPENIDMRLSRTALLRTAGRAEEADADLAALAAQNPIHAGVRMTQAQVALDDGRPQEALDMVAAYEAGVGEDQPDDTSSEETLIWVNVPGMMITAEAAMELGQDDRAIAEMAKLRDMFDDDASTLNSLCWAAAKAGRLLEQALRDCDAALALAPNSPAILDSRARVLLEQGDTAGALAGYDAALARAPRLAASLYGRGLARIALDQTEAGEADKAAALEIAPSVTDSFSNSRWVRPAT